MFNGTELVDILTYTADLHEAESSGSLRWSLEYDFRQHFVMNDLSPASFEELHSRLAEPASALWNDYRGKVSTSRMHSKLCALESYCLGLFCFCATV